MYKSENGSALVLVLVVSSLLLASSLWAVSTYRQGVMATEQLMNKFEARLGAESALQILKYYGATGRFSSSTLTNSLPENVNFPVHFSLAGEEYELTLGNNTIHISLLDSSAMLNCYYMESGLLSGLLRHLDIEDEQRFIIESSFLDWVDSDDYHRMSGAESFYYRQQRAPYGPRNSEALQSIWEISLLRGMDKTVWNTLQPFLALVPKPGLNIQTMSPSMLAAYFGLNAAQATQLVGMRSDSGYLTITAIEDITGRKYNDTFAGLGNFPSRILQVTIEAESGNSKERWEGWLNFIPDRQGPYRILSWKEGAGD